MLLVEVAFVSCDIVEDSSARDLVERWPGISAVKLKDDFLEVTVIDSTLVILEAVMRLSDVERLERSSIVMKKERKKEKKNFQMTHFYRGVSFGAIAFILSRKNA